MKYIRKRSPIKPLVIALNALLLGVSASSAQTTIILDDFSGSSPLPSHTPNIDLMGNPWGIAGDQSTWGTPVSGYNYVAFNTDLGGGINLQGYTFPGNALMLSATLAVGQIGGDDANKRGMYLGYYRDITLNPNISTVDFTGLLLDATDGSLNVLNNDSTGNSTVVSSQAYQGSWDSGQTHDLSYTIDTMSGSIVSATLDSQDYTFAATSVFASTNLNWVGLGTSAPGAYQKGYAANFLLTAEQTPEPGTLALAVLGGVGTLVCVQRRKQSR